MKDKHYRVLIKNNDEYYKLINYKLDYSDGSFYVNFVGSNSTNRHLTYEINFPENTINGIIQGPTKIETKQE